MRVYAIVTREHPELQLLDIDHDDSFDDWMAKEAKTASITELSYSPEV